MTLKYESEILFDLMKRDGDDAPSDVLPYESELKEKYLHQVEGAYPKLMDYRPEWLYYNLNAHLPADFPVESVSNVTNATFENVVPYAYGSAILNGQTLVNLVDNMIVGSTSFDVEMTYSSNAKSYFVIIESNIAIIEVGLLESQTSWNVRQSVSNLLQLKIKLTPDTTKDIFRLRCIFSNPDLTPINAKCMIIEYQEGLENWDIPYFEGMKSVQMPVLTTTGKNLFDMNRPYDNVTSAEATVIQKVDEITVSSAVSGTYVNANFILDKNFFKGKTVTGSCLYESDMNGIGTVQINYQDTTGKKYYQSIKTPRTFTFPNELVGDVLLCIYVNNTGTPQANTITVKNIQLELGSIATTFKEHKSNILTVNEPVELRGIGDVKDELNLLTGELTQSLVERVFDGTENWIIGGVGDNYKLFRCESYTDMIKSSNIIISDKYAYSTTNNASSNLNITNSTTTGKPCIVTSQVDLSLDEFKSKLSLDKPRVQYQLAEKVVKTVELTVTDQDGNTASIIRPIEGTMHVSTSSQTLPPLLDMIVPVEATTQNLMSFANIEEEE